MVGTDVPKRLNVVVLGATRVGKTCLISQLTENRVPSFYEATPKSARKKSVVYNSREYACVITDTVSHATATPLSPQFVIGTHVFILVFSVTSRESFDLIKVMHEKIVDFCGDDIVPVVVVGNKQDLQLQREISFGEGQVLADSLRCSYAETTSSSYQSICEYNATLELCIQSTELRAHIRSSGGVKLESRFTARFLQLRSFWQHQASMFRQGVQTRCSQFSLPKSKTLLNLWAPGKFSMPYSLRLSFPEALSLPRPTSWIPILPRIQSGPEALPIAMSAPRHIDGPEESTTLKSSPPNLEEVLFRHLHPLPVDDSQRTLVVSTEWPSDDVKIRALKGDLISDPDSFIRTLQMALNSKPLRDSGASRASKGKATVKLSSMYSDLADDFLAVSEDRVAAKALVALQGDQAQTVLDVLQMILDSESTFLTRADRARILQLLLNLANDSGLYPRCLVLSGISRAQTHAITAGHFGEIWMGRLRRRSVCMKVVKVYQRSDVNRIFKVFAREAILWSHLCHANVLPFYGIHRLEDDVGRICLISPWMDNGCVGEYLLRFPSTNRYSIIHEVCQGLLYLHNQGIVHGDLKGVNILVTRSGRACLADFGLSSIAESEYTRWSSTGSSLHLGGTTRWQAPELFDPESESAKPTKLSDIYSLGCVFYEIFTGNVPFHEVQRESTVISLVQSGRKPSRPSSNSPAFSEWGLSKTIWNTCINECWSRFPGERPSIPYILTQLAPFVVNEREDRGKAPESNQDVPGEGWLSPSQIRNAIRIESANVQRLSMKLPIGAAGWLGWMNNPQVTAF